MKHVSIVRKSFQIFLSILMLPLLSSALRADDFYSEPQVCGMRPNPGHEWDLGPIGATGIDARFYKGVKLTVESIAPGSPADGKLNKGDIILSVNGSKLPGSNPLVVLGEALTKAEAEDGKLVLEIEPIEKDAPDKVTINIPVLGEYSKTFPLKCEKSKKIIRKAADFYAGKDRLKAYNMWNALACLFLLSTGDDQYVPRVKEYFARFLTPEGEVKGIGSHSWYNEYRPELIRRHQASEKPDGALLDMIIELTELKQDIAGWEPIGNTALETRVWRYRTYDPPEDEQLHRRIGPPKRMRATTLSKDMENWFTPGFDDSKWKSGRAPIGKGIFKAHGHGRGHAEDPEFYYENNSEWDDGEFIVARTTFELTEDDLKKDYFRLRVLCPQGYHIYLNGEKIHSYAWFHNMPLYVQHMLGDNQIKHLKTGTNTLAVRSVTKYSQDKDSGKYSEMAQIDVYIEALDKSDIGM